MTQLGAASDPFADMTESRRRWLLWCGLLVAFSPVVQNLAANLRDHPGKRYVVLPILLMGLLLRKDPGSKSDTRTGLGRVLLLVGLAAQVTGIAASSWSLARIGLPVAMVGMAFITGRPAISVIVLAFALVPIPTFLQNLASPQVESILAKVSAGAYAWLGVDLEAHGPFVQQDGVRFQLVAADNGIVTLSVFVQLGWYLALRAGSALRESVARAARWGLLGIVLQPVFVLLCVAALPLGDRDLGRFCLTHGPWLVLGFGVILLNLWPRTGTLNTVTRNVGATD